MIARTAVDTAIEGLKLGRRHSRAVMNQSIMLIAQLRERLVLLQFGAGNQATGDIWIAIMTELDVSNLNPNFRCRIKQSSILASLLVGLFAISGEHSAIAKESNEIRSATVARDVNGFQLGMSVAEARSISALEYIGGDQLTTNLDSIRYNFGVTPSGRIYRVQSTQAIGDFEIDRAFISSVRKGLTDKYGEPTTESGANWSWEIVESIADRNGRPFNFRTNWMSAYVGSSGMEKTLEITMIDFRILWADQAKVNDDPRNSAGERLKF